MFGTQRTKPNASVMERAQDRTIGICLLRDHRLGLSLSHLYSFLRVVKHVMNAYHGITS